MEKFYHINNKGIPSECKAKSPEKCRFHRKHFDDYNKALEYADSINEQIKKVDICETVLKMPKLNNLLNKLSEKGAKTYFVGGIVRDEFLNKESKDLDIEIHNISVEDFKKTLKENNIEAGLVGESFGVFKARLDGEDIDLSFPRTEKQLGNKHTDFEITIDPFVGLKKASERRDFTIGAIMKDTRTGEIIDFHNGIQDLKDGIIRHTSDKFTEDGLRIYRAAQFASRFNFKIADETKKLFSPNLIKDLSNERVKEELKKAIEKSTKPSIFFNSLEDDLLKVHFPSVVENRDKLKYLDKFSKTNHQDKDFSSISQAILYKFTKASDKEIKLVTNEKEVLRLINKIPPLEEFKKVNSKNVLKFIHKDKDLIPRLLPLFKNEKFIQESVNKYNRIEFITSTDLINKGIKPGKEFGMLLKELQNKQLQGKSKEEILKNIQSLN